MRITPATDRDPLAGKALRFRRSAAELCKFKRLKRAQRDVVSLQRGAGSLPMAFSEGGLGPPILCKLLWLIWWATSLGQACTRMPSMPIFSREVAKTLRNVFGISSGYKHDSPTSESVVSKVAALPTLAANAASSPGIGEASRRHQLRSLTYLTVGTTDGVGLKPRTAYSKRERPLWSVRIRSATTGRPSTAAS